MSTSFTGYPSVSIRALHGFLVIAFVNIGLPPWMIVSFSNQYTIEMEICKIEVIEKVSPDKKDLTFLKKMPTIPVS